VAAKEEDYLMPKLVEEFPVAAPVLDLSDIKEAEEPLIIHWELEPVTPMAVTDIRVNILGNNTHEATGNSTVGKMSTAGQSEEIISTPLHQSVPPIIIKETDAEMILSMKDSTSSTSPVSAASGGYLARPSNIYAETKTEAITSKTSAEEPVPATKKPASIEQDELLDLQMQLVERDDIPAADMPNAHQAQPPLSTKAEDPAMQDEAEEQKRRAAERLHKLRNLSFNVNAADPNNEFETVPAYIRRNMELYNSNIEVENFYSSYEVKTDQNNQIQISTINNFLDGKKPD
jgi:cell division protein FtsZ